MVPRDRSFRALAQVYGGQKIPSKFFMESDSCKRCHETSTNNGRVRRITFHRSIISGIASPFEYMQDVVGTKPSKWCGGCHETQRCCMPAKWIRPSSRSCTRPKLRPDSGCMMCHAIADVKSTMGQGDFYLEYPKLHELAASKNPVVRYLHDTITKLNPRAASPRVSQALHPRANG